LRRFVPSARRPQIDGRATQANTAAAEAMRERDGRRKAMFRRDLGRGRTATHNRKLTRQYFYTSPMASSISFLPIQGLDMLTVTISVTTAVPKR
jgi:hypothetical protein